MIIKNARRTAVALALVAFGAVSAQAQTQNVAYSVSAINQISFAGAPVLNINTAVAGTAPTPATDNSATWAVTTNTIGAKVTAQVILPLPTGLTLSAAMAAPTGGAVAAALQALGSAPVDMVTGISQLAQGPLGVSYKLDATTLARPGSGTIVVTYTIVTGT